MAELDWTPAGPRSVQFGDVYFSAEDGLAESRAVFLAGCGLPEAWAGRQRFSVAELGFGTGLNMAALLALWSEARPPGATLHLMSVERFPLNRAQAERALGAWPELRRVTARMLERWPTGEGWRRIDWPELGATLDLFHGEALEGLQGWDGLADAWFLDGFAPSRNADMWRPELLSAVRGRSAPGARLATFTVAGQVRRGLAAAGFEVERRPGFGRKRERLEARLQGEPHPPQEHAETLILGAGVAGAAVARALRALALPARLMTASGLPMTSGNPAALVSPRFDVGDDPAARLHRQAFARAIDLYTDVPEAVIARGLLQLPTAERDLVRFARLDGRPAGRGAMRVLTGAEAAERLGEATGSLGLDVPDALVIEPAAVLAAWSGATPKLFAQAHSLQPTEARWLVLSASGETRASARQVVLCGGFASRLLWPSLPLSALRGQATVVEGATPSAAVAWGGYAIPTRDGLLFGATHDRNDDGFEARPGDDHRNRAALAARLPGLEAGIAAVPMRGHAGVRAVTPDHLPLAGELAPGLFVLAGLGGRGFTTAPLLAEHVAALIAGAPSPLPRDLAAAVAPR